MCFEKRDVSRTTATSKMELFVALVSGLLVLTNSKKIFILGLTRASETLKRVLKFAQVLKLSKVAGTKNDF